MAAGALLVGLLPAQGAVLEGALSYDLTVRGVGTFAVFVGDGRRGSCGSSRRRPRGEALFHLTGDPLVLAELLAGERRQGRPLPPQRAASRAGASGAQELAGAAGGASSRWRRRRGRARGSSRRSSIAALPFAIDPEWTRGHTLHGRAADRRARAARVARHARATAQPLQVVEHTSEAAADATVTMTRAAFDRMLRDEPAALGERPRSAATARPSRRSSAGRTSPAAL